jgi:hypothetical protein
MLVVNKKNHHLIFTFCILFFILTGCKKETVTLLPVSLNYFPTEIGNWIEYTVDSIYHADNDNNNDDSVYSYHYELREVIDGEFEDGEGRINQIIKRYSRSDSTQDWQLLNVCTQYLSSMNAYRNENNINLHKLSFPINSTISWNGNDANVLDEEIHYYEYFHEPASFNGLDFDSTLSVLQIDEDNFLEKIYGNEIYGAGIGLIFKARDELGKINGVVVSGLEYRMAVKGYGND